MKIQILEPCLSAAQLLGSDIVLQGNSELFETKHPKRNSGIGTVESKIDTEKLFFYTISHHSDKRFPLMAMIERGVGRLTSGNRLVRETVMEFSNHNGHSGVWFTEGQKLSVSNYTPRLDQCKSFFNNSIFTSDSVIELGPNQFIFCDAKGDIREGNARDISNLLNSQKKPLEANKGVYFKPTLPPERPKAGTIVFNKRSGCLEFYDGLEWKEIA